MKNIVSAPQDQMNDFTVKFNVGKRKVCFDILTNIKEDEIFAVIHNWTGRTNDFTAKSLVNYINSKSQYGFKAELKK